jgi:hypothetical protein
LLLVSVGAGQVNQGAAWQRGRRGLRRPKSVFPTFG